MNREEFITRCMTFAAGVVCLDVFTGCAALPFVTHEMDGSTAIVNKSEFEDKEYVLIQVEALPAPVFVSKQQEDGYSAILLKCSHRGCQVQPAGEIMECPCHGSRYTRTGTVIRGPAPKDLINYPIETTIDSIRILLA